MAQHDGFWKLEQLSDAQLLESLVGVLRSQRRTLAELVAHLAEVEDQRLHLEAAYSSMFAYCVERLAMSEDEACRRIELARLARRFPALFLELASGQITLSVALVLKPVLSASNHLELLSAARGKCVRQARELVAEHFPKADAPSSIRKLPERRPVEAAGPAQAVLPGPWSASLLASIPAAPPQPALAQPAVPATSSSPAFMPRPALAQPAVPAASSAPAFMPQPALTQPAPGGPASMPQPSPPMPSLPSLPAAPSERALPSPAAERQAHAPAPGGGSPRVSRSSIEPLSARRYRVQFTADEELKQKLERARDLLRHAHPDGDFGPIVSRALDLLLADVLRRRFGAGARRKGPRSASATAAGTPPPAPTAGVQSNTSTLASSAPASSAPQASSFKPARPANAAAVATSPTPPSVPRPPTRRSICWWNSCGPDGGSAAG